VLQKPSQALRRFTLPAAAAAGLIAWIALHSMAGAQETGEPETGARKAGAPGAVARDKDWEAVFTRASGWTGADVAASIDLLDGRTLWVFGDTWIGNVADGKHAKGSRLVNNSLAVHRWPPQGKGPAPEPGEVEFHWGPNNEAGHPTAWIVPKVEGQGDAAASQPGDWFWPTGGGVTIPRRGEANRLVLFLYRVRRGDRPGTSWNFQVVGTSMAIVDDVRAPVTKWTARQIDLPAMQRDDEGRGAAGGEIHWGQAVVRVPSAGDNAAASLYVFGVANVGRLERKMLVARVPEDRIERPEEWQVYAGPERWSADQGEAVPIAGAASSEFSIFQASIGGARRWVWIQSEPLFGHRILARTAERPEGPWSEPIALHTVAEVQGKSSLFTYAAKGHQQLSGKDGLLVTYIVSSHQFSELVNNAALYRPRCVRVPWSTLAGEKSPR